MAGLTKDELKSALVSHGVEMNLSAAKKDELVSLYDEFVAPHEEKAGEFSSDDENGTSPNKKVKKASRSSKATIEKENGSTPSKKGLTEENSFIVDEINVGELSDEELIKYLQKYNIEVGPIVESTRSLYQKKLAIVMREKTADQTDNNGAATQQQNGHSNSDKSLNSAPLKDKSIAEFSADDETANDETEDEDQPSPVVKKSSQKSNTPKPKTKKESKTSPLQALGTSLRQRFSGTPTEAKSRENGRFTPTPRRSIHSYKITETTTQTMTKSKDGMITQDITSTKETSESKGEIGGRNTKMATLLKILPGFFMLLIIASLAYYVFTKCPDELSSMLKTIFERFDSAISSIKAPDSISTVQESHPEPLPEEASSAPLPMINDNQGE